MTVTKIAGTMDYIDANRIVWTHVDTDDDGFHAVQSKNLAGTVHGFSVFVAAEGDTFYGDDGEYTVRGGKWTL